MPNKLINDIVNQHYPYGFVTAIEADAVTAGLNEETIRLISAKKNEPLFLLEWRLKAFKHWQTLTPPKWSHLHYQTIDYQDIVYYSAPKSNTEGPKNLEEVDPKLLETYKKLGIPLHEQG